MNWENLITEIYLYENNFKLLIDSLVKGCKMPFEIQQFDKNIRFKFNSLEYTKGVNYVDPKINQALHHYLINTRGEFIRYLIKNNNDLKTNALNIGLLNNVTFPYIATSKYSTNFLNTSTLMFEAVQNSLICDRTLLGTINYQYLSKMNYIFSSKEWVKLNEIAKLNKLHEFESEIFVDMLKTSSDTVTKLIDNKILPHNYSNLNLDQIVILYKDLLEATFQMSKDYNYQFNDINFKSGLIKEDTICQICYDIKTIKAENKVLVELDGLVVNSDILKNINLENTKNFSFEDIIKKIKDEHELFKVNLVEIENAAILKMSKES